MVELTAQEQRMVDHLLIELRKVIREELAQSKKFQILKSK